MSVRFLRKIDQKVFDTESCLRNLNLLAHAQIIELEIGSQCGGHGICGGDRIRFDVAAVPAGALSPITEAEKEHLTPEQLANGWRLACQCFPEKDELELTPEF